MIKAREFLWELVEDVTGRAAHDLATAGSAASRRTCPRASTSRCRRRSRRRGRCSRKSHTLLTGNRIFMDRMVGRRRALAGRRRSPGGSPGRCCARRACRSTSAQDAALLGVRPDRVRGPAREERRQLRPLPGPHGRDGAVHADRRAGARAACPAAPSTWTGRGGRSIPPPYVDRGKQGKTEGLLLTAHHALAEPAGPGARGAHARVNAAGQARGAAAEGGRRTARSRG